ncbi:MAG: terminase small subunit [Carnobacterium sp.]|uniref:terminase small subunit n=1 Tax=Carnobacterium sp. TaxID=48221 RepID=UPI003315D2D0
MINWEEIRKEFEETDITMKLLAEKHDIKATTLRSRKNREKWQQRNGTKNVATKNATQHKNVATQKVEEVLDDSGLTEKQKLFCLYYLQSFNATQSYIKAYDCTYNTAMVEGSKCLRNPKINNQLDKLKAEIHQELKVSILDIANEHAKMGFSDLGDYIEFSGERTQLLNQDGKPLKDEDGNMMVTFVDEVRLIDSNKVDTSLIKEIKQGKDGITFKLYDRQKSLDKLEKLIPKDNSNKTEDELNCKLLEARIAQIEAQTFRIKAENGDFDDEMLEDDGFMDAINGMVTNKEVWPDED